MSEYVTNVSAKKWLSVGKLGKFHCDMFIFKLLLVKWQFLFQNTLQ